MQGSYFVGEPFGVKCHARFLRHLVHKEAQSVVQEERLVSKNLAAFIYFDSLFQLAKEVRV
jgi:hypothetical protein